MKVQTLIASMNQHDYSLAEKLHIETDAIIGNQTDKNSIETVEYSGHKVTYLNFNERGVGLNRNNCFMRADADICLFGDDDVEYFEGYSEIITREFENNPDADVIVFNIKETVPTRYIINKRSRVHFFNGFRYGAVRIACRTQSVRFAGVSFNLLFGGGTPHGHGEDVLFIQDCLKKHLHIYTSPEYICKLNDSRDSTWFKGYDDKFLADHGALFKAVSKRYWKLLCFQDAVRHAKSVYKCGTVMYCYKKMVTPNSR